MLIGLDGNMTPINIDLIRSKVKVKFIREVSYVMC